MIDAEMHVDRWSSDKHPYVPGKALLWLCTLELRSERGRLSFGLDLPWREVERLNALFAGGRAVRLSEIFGAEPTA